MHSAYHQVPFPPNSPSPPLRQSKVVTQRQYREKEGDSFNALRDAIKQLTGDELEKRHEILCKAIDLLSSLLKMRRQEATQVASSSSLVPREMLVTAATNPLDATSVHLDYSAQSSQWPQPLQVPEFDARVADYYTTQTFDHSVQFAPYFDQADYH